MLNKLTAFKQKFSLNQGKIIKNLAWLFFDRVLGTGTAFLIGVWLARYLDPEQYGVLRYVTAFAYLFSPLTTLGMNSIVIRELVENPSLKNELLGTVCVIRLISSCFAAVLTIICIYISAPTEPFTWVLVAIVCSSFFLQPLSIVEQWFESQIESKYIVVSRTTSLVVVTTLRIICLVNKAPLITFVCLLVLEVAIYVFTLVFLYIRKYDTIKTWVFNLSRVKYLFKESLPLLLTGIAVTLYLKIDQVMLGQMVEKSAVGVYAVAATLSEIWYVIPVAFVSSLYPAIIKSKKLSKDVYEKRLQKFYDLMALIAYSIIILFIPVSHYLIVSAYGVEYEGAVQILYIYLWNCIFSFQGIAQGAWIVSEGLQQFNFYSTASGAVINVLLNLVLIPRFQGLGAAIATLISYAFASYFCYLIFPRTRHSAIFMTKAILLPLRLPGYVFNRKP